MTTEINDEFRFGIKKLIIETLNISDVDPAEVDDDEPLFGGNNVLTLDSVDAIEIIMAIQRVYQIRIADQSTARHAIRSINSIAEYILTEKARLSA